MLTIFINLVLWHHFVDVDDDGNDVDEDGDDDDGETHQKGERPSPSFRRSNHH